MEIKKLVNQTRKNQESGIISYESNQDLQEYLDKGMMKMGLNMLFQNFMNKLRSPERQVMLP